MPNPYIDQEEPTPSPTPPKPAPTIPNLVYIAVILGIAGIFLPPNGGWNFDKTNPDPPPYVEPNPKPSPVPVIDITTTKDAWVVIVEETSERTPDIANMLNDSNEFWKGLETRGLKWRIYDKDSPDATAYKKIADTIGYPTLFVIGSQGILKNKVLHQGPLTTIPEMDATIKKVTGR